MRGAALRSLRWYGIGWGLLLLISPAFGFDCTFKPKAQDLAKLSALPTEAEIGQWAAASIMREYRLLSEGAMAQRVRVITERLRGVVRQRADLRYPVEILDTRQQGACAYPGGYVFLTRGLIEQATDDDRLALVVAHELAHIVTGQMDRPMEHELPTRLEQRLIEMGAVGRGFASELRTRFCQSMTADEIRKVNELQADEHAIVYVALAGYNPVAAVRILDAISTQAASSCQPSTGERKARIGAQVQGVLDQLEKFQAGVQFYVHKEYERAAELFTAFLSVYPGREVHHNLATAYHRLALHHQEPARQLAAACSLTLESETQARRFQVRQPRSPAGLDKFQVYLTEAIQHYMQALEQDRAYVPAAANLACAYLAQGKYARAQGELEDALQANPASAMTHNNLGVAFWLQGQHSKAVEHLQQAVRLDPHYADPHCNLALLQETQGQAAQAHPAWQQYHKLGGAGTQRCARLARERLGLSDGAGLSEKQAGAERAALPLQPGQPLGAWAKPQRAVALFPLCVPREERPCPQLQMVRYGQEGITVLVDGQTITQVAISSPSTRATAQGIHLHHTDEDVRRRYGTPTRIEEMSTGRYLVYDHLNLAFALHDGTVVSWFVFQ